MYNSFTFKRNQLNLFNCLNNIAVSKVQTMILIPKKTYALSLNFLKNNQIAADQFQDYLKWLRFFLDFCDRYVVASDKSERLRLFLEKLREKKTE